jgi:hypothetical protein
MVVGSNEWYFVFNMELFIFLFVSFCPKYNRAVGMRRAGKSPSSRSKTRGQPNKIETSVGKKRAPASPEWNAPPKRAKLPEPEPIRVSFSPENPESSNPYPPQALVDSVDYFDTPPSPPPTKTNLAVPTRSKTPEILKDIPLTNASRLNSLFGSSEDLPVLNSSLNHPQTADLLSLSASFQRTDTEELLSTMIHNRKKDSPPKATTPSVNPAKQALLQHATNEQKQINQQLEQERLAKKKQKELDELRLAQECPWIKKGQSKSQAQPTVVFPAIPEIPRRLEQPADTRNYIQPISISPGSSEGSLPISTPSPISPNSPVATLPSPNLSPTKLSPNKSPKTSPPKSPTKSPEIKIYRKPGAIVAPVTPMKSLRAAFSEPDPPHHRSATIAPIILCSGLSTAWLEQVSPFLDFVHVTEHRFRVSCFRFVC